jgi:hypothetical protein
MRIDVVTQPAVEPVSLADIWDWLNLIPTTDSPQATPFDAKLASMIASAREYCEALTNRAFVRQTVKLTLSRFPRLWCGYYPGYGYVMDHASWPIQHDPRRYRVIELPRPPLVSIESVNYYDLNNTLQTVDPADYLVSSGNMPATLQPINNAWPDTYLREDAVQITFVCGYEGSGSPPDLTDGIPKGIIQAVKLTVEKNFNPMSADQQKQLEDAIGCSLARHKVYTL